ncbi:DUF5753 domain-containing protein [Streptomyces sp. MB09-02B]|uniref:DUF5753 domain-containing protein n=1 Tax=Streptomyces sp. MB09-02B TaxID=3028667 RepID=UPI0029AD3C70|nr:DUF5753 domain-containing protein [Streptomyces sp. MB09-02B]MDX3640717.1 DUF5753 domain-containing protein [Streptomyces sp. MB09-02B]
MLPQAAQRESRVPPRSRASWRTPCPESSERAYAALPARSIPRAVSRLAGARPPRLHAVVHEAALHASLGDPRIMREQLQRLIEASRLPHVTVRILPFDGPVPFGSSVTLVEPVVRPLGTVIVAHIEKSLHLGDAEAIARYTDLFARLREAALPPVDAGVPPEGHAAKDSLGLIQRLLHPLL